MPTSKHLSRLNKKLNDAFADYIKAVALSEAAAQEHLFGGGAVAELEKKIASHYGMRYALCVSSATVGLFAIALALGLKNTEFITSPYTYGGSLASWLIPECKPVFADIDPLTMTLDGQQARRCITAKTRAILAVDVLGNPSDTKVLRELADNFGLWYVADCAQSFGARRQGSPASHLADALVVSFTSGKTLFAGEGGAIVTSNQGLYEKLLFYSQHPFRQKRELGSGVSNELAFNGRIHPLAAIWANAEFKESLRLLAQRQSGCFRLIEFLNESSLTEPVTFVEQDILPSFFRLTVQLKRAGTEAELVGYLAERGISAVASPVPVSIIYRQPAFKAQYQKQFRLPTPCRVAERQAKERIVINLGGAVKESRQGRQNSITAKEKKI